ncbi:hypothetical protein TNCV_1026031 [Trichonephila clavipes]|nr:hypothetical protein TNCV_1026031 [Trichonephila clavipes]
MHVKSVEAQSPLGNAVWKLGGGCQLRCRSRHLTMVQNHETRHNNALFASECDRSEQITKYSACVEVGKPIDENSACVEVGKPIDENSACVEVGTNSV